MAFYSIFLYLTFGILLQIPQSFENRIAGGSDANIADYPYQVSLRYLDMYTCGGSLITDLHIVTAAHCIDINLPPSDYSIRYGSSNHADGQEIVIESFTLHPSYIPQSYDNDIAIAKLTSNVIFSNTANAISLGTMVPDIGTRAWISGWGQTSANSTEISSILQATDVYIADNRACERSYELNFTSNMFCALGFPDHGICMSDVGGPFAVNGELVGIISLLASCGDPAYPSVYMSVPNYAQFIQDAIIS